MQDLIFNHQLTHQRTVIGTIGRARRKWKRLYPWYPAEQNRVYSEMHRVYMETRQQYGQAMFNEYAQQRRLSKRIMSEVADKNTDREDYDKFKSLYPLIEKHNRLPLLYYDEKCGDLGLCQT